MKIGFIQITCEYDAQWLPSLAFGSLKAYLHTYLGVPAEMIRVEANKLHECDIAAISTTSQDYGDAMIVARNIKRLNPNTVTVLGGHHVTCLPTTLTRDFDFGVIGEGEQTFLELVRYVMNGKKEEDLFKIPGIVFWRDGGLLFAPPQPLIDPLDRLPFPFREAAPKPHLFTTRGCPYKCTFCSSSFFWKKTRFHSADYVVNEIEALIGMGADDIPIWDDLFIVDRRRFIDIMTKLRERGLDKRFYITSVTVRANLVDDELCHILSEFNPPIVATHFGAESGSDRILKLMGKNTTVAKNQEALDRLKSIGMPTGCTFIVGWPTETEEELLATLNFFETNMKAGKIFIDSTLNILTPLPGTPVWNDAVKAGKIDINTLDWNRLRIWASYTASMHYFPNFDSWVAERRKNNSVYLNEEYVPQERLFEILREHHRMIDKFARGG
jgi:radical SAM superfamily enzyme YgiQ (UPF0313 family)